MTFLEKLKQENPQIDVEDVIATDCPFDYEYEKRFKCKLMNDNDKYACKRCWEREMPNTEPSCDDVKEAYEQGLKAYEDSKIKVGDVVVHKDDGDACGVVSRVQKNGYMHILFIDGSAGMHQIKDFKKTGKHIDIQSILSQIGGE